MVSGMRIINGTNNRLIKKKKRKLKRKAEEKKNRKVPAYPGHLEAAFKCKAVCIFEKKKIREGSKFLPLGCP